MNIGHVQMRTMDSYSKIHIVNRNDSSRLFKTTQLSQLSIKVDSKSH